MAEAVRCPYCRQRHMPRYLCDPAKGFLDAVQARGESFTMPTIELSQPIHPPGLGEGAGDTLVRQLVVQAGLLEGGGVVHPALVFTGHGLTGRLPQWTYVATDEQLMAAAQLVREMAEISIRRADDANRERRNG